MSSSGSEYEGVDGSEKSDSSSAVCDTVGVSWLEPNRVVRTRDVVIERVHTRHRVGGNNEAVGKVTYYISDAEVTLVNEKAGYINLV